MTDIKQKKKKKYIHSHPINIIEHSTKYLILLIFPLLRAFFFDNMGFYEWLRGAWFDMLIILLILLLGFWAWYKYVYYLGKRGIYIVKGIILPKRRFISYKKLSVIAVEHPYYFRPLGAVRVSADTDGGSPTTPDFSVTMRQHELEPFLEKAKAPFVNYNELKKVYLPKSIYIALLSFVTSNTITGVLFTSTLISGSGKVLGSEFERLLMERINDVVRILAVGLPPFAGMIAFIILGGWGVSFILNLLRHLRFSVTRQSNTLDIKTGIVSLREYIITVSRINLVELRQSLLTKLFGYFVVFIHSNGYGKRKDELSILMPSGGKKEIRQNIELLLPEINLSKKAIKPKLKYLSRFLIPPLSWIGGIAAGCFILLHYFYRFRDIIVFLGIMALIPAFWYLLVKIVSFCHSGVGKNDNSYTFYYTYVYRIKTVVVPKERIVKLTIRRSLFQVMAGCCDVVILTFSEGRKRHVVPNLNFQQAIEMFEMTDCYPPVKKPFFKFKLK